MAINFDSIQSQYAATLTISQNNELLKIEFAHVLDQDVLEDVQGLKVQPFIRLFSVYSNQRVFDITVDTNYSLAEVAEAVAQKLESHRLKVKRQVGIADRRQVSSFIEKLSLKPRRSRRGFRAKSAR